MADLAALLNEMALKGEAPVAPEADEKGARRARRQARRRARKAARNRD